MITILPAIMTTIVPCAVSAAGPWRPLRRRQRATRVVPPLHAPTPAPVRRSLRRPARQVTHAKVRRCRQAAAVATAVSPKHPGPPRSLGKYL